jgi:hypothetical protein
MAIKRMVAADKPGSAIKKRNQLSGGKLNDV